MEELQSPEVLEREILEDARKKAFKILKTADEVVQTHTEAWEKKTADAVTELENHYAARRQQAVVEILARLPLEMRRIWSEKVEGFLHSAAESWFRDLSRSQALDILDRELEKRLADCPDFAAAGTIRVMPRRLSQAEAGALIKKHLSGAALVFENSPSAGNDEIPASGGGPEDYPELVLDIPAVKLSASIRQAVDLILLKKRAELIEALLGPDALLGPGGTTGDSDFEGAQGD
jgi:vacuolar-type H+-ATPase subunit E/Vma4